MWDSYRDIIECAVTVLAIVIGVIAVTITTAAGFYYIVDSRECAAKSQVMNLQNSWGFWQGCMVETKGEVLPLKIYLDQKSKQGMEIEVSNK